jgi:prepilin-type processing-associated H-X9-DG protein
VPVNTYRCPSVPDRQVTSAVAKSPRPAMTFPNPLGVTDYEAVMGVQPNSVNPHTGGIYNSGNRFAPMFRNSTVRLTDVGDGTSTTILLVECGGRPLVYRNRTAQPGLSNDQGIGWADSEGPFSFDGAAANGSAEGCGAACVAVMNAKNDNEPYSFHSTGSNILFTDGHVAFVKESVSLPTFAALCTMNAGEVVTNY